MNKDLKTTEGFLALSKKLSPFTSELWQDVFGWAEERAELLRSDCCLKRRFFFLCKGLASTIISSSSKVGSQFKVSALGTKGGGSCRPIRRLYLRFAINLVFLRAAQLVTRFSGSIWMRLWKNLANSGDQSESRSRDSSSIAVLAVPGDANAYPSKMPPSAVALLPSKSEHGVSCVSEAHFGQKGHIRTPNKCSNARKQSKRKPPWVVLLHINRWKSTCQEVKDERDRTGDLATVAREVKNNINVCTETVA